MGGAGRGESGVAAVVMDTPPPLGDCLGEGQTLRWGERGCALPSKELTTGRATAARASGSTCTRGEKLPAAAAASGGAGSVGLVQLPASLMAGGLMREGVCADRSFWLPLWPSRAGVPDKLDTLPMGEEPPSATTSGTLEGAGALASAVASPSAAVSPLQAAPRAGLPVKLSRILLSASGNSSLRITAVGSMVAAAVRASAA